MQHLTGARLAAVRIVSRVPLHPPPHPYISYTRPLRRCGTPHKKKISLSIPPTVKYSISSAGKLTPETPLG